MKKTNPIKEQLLMYKRGIFPNIFAFCIVLFYCTVLANGKQNTWGLDNVIFDDGTGAWASDGMQNIIGTTNNTNTLRDKILNDPINQIIEFYGFSVSGYTNENFKLSGDTNSIGFNNDTNVLRDYTLNHPIDQTPQHYDYNILEQLPAVVTSITHGFSYRKDPKAPTKERQLVSYPLIKNETFITSYIIDDAPDTYDPELQVWHR